MMSFRLRSWLLIPALAATMAGGAFAQQGESVPATQAAEKDPLKRPLSPEEQKKRAKALYKELADTYKTWLESDVKWIITDEERNAFLQMSNDEERDQFIEQFWVRRDPTPDTVENEFKDEHYRRIAYANERFAAGIPGWKTDRGRMYITFGPPDEIESHASGGTYERPMEEGGGTTSTYPFEKWRWRYIEGIGQEIIVEFVDSCMCGEYRMTMDRSEKDALLMIPGAGLTWWEQQGRASKDQRFDGRFERMGSSPFSQGDQSKFFDRMDIYAKLQRPPAVKFKDLEAIVTTKISVNLMPFDVRADFIRVTSDTVLVPITIQVKNRDVTFNSKEGVSKGVVNIFGRLSTLTGRIAQTFEDTVSVDVPDSLLERTKDNSAVYWKALPLRTGRYRMDVVVKDVNGDRVGTWSKSVVVPEYSEDKLASSTLILADQMERVARQNVGSGNFVIGTTKVRPRIEPSNGQPASFKRNERLNLWMQVYNLSADGATKKTNATVEYEIVNFQTKQPVVKAVESTDKMNNPGEQLTIEKSLSLAKLQPGIYQVTIKVNDLVSKQTIAPTAKFVVE